MRVTYFFGDREPFTMRVEAQTLTAMLAEIESNGFTAKVLANYEGFDLIEVTSPSGFAYLATVQE